VVPGANDAIEQKASKPGYIITDPGLLHACVCIHLTGILFLFLKITSQDGINLASSCSTHGSVTYKVPVLTGTRDELG